MAKENKKAKVEESLDEKVDKDVTEEVASETTNEVENNEAEVENVEETVAEAAEDGNEADKKDKKDILIEELNDKYMRTFAEFDNFRKRTEKEKAAMFEVGAKSIIEKILPIVDSFERGLATLTEEMVKALEEAGVTPIEAVGKEFDPNLHNAVMHGEDDSLGENIVAEEYQKGYMYRESVVRYSMVKVVN